MNKEVHYEGWLIKSPPTKRIWRARWRRRWFTLKQGEIPEQFCLEYYTDRNCRKLKGVIDLDQCEQVDCGLRLENRKQKFQYMFDIKTPKRTYYLAADTESDMRDWVNCICQVCHLHDVKQSNEGLQVENRLKGLESTLLPKSSSNASRACIPGAFSTSDVLNNSTCQAFSKGQVGLSMQHAQQALHQQQQQQHNFTGLPNVHQINNNNNNNQSDCSYVNTDYANCLTNLSNLTLEQQPQLQKQQQIRQQPLQQQQPQLQTSANIADSLYHNNSVIPKNVQQHEKENKQIVTQITTTTNTNSLARKTPENLVLNNIPLSGQQSVQPSPALSTASGPYIPISECFSGSPKLNLSSDNPTTPLNNLDPKFYDTPRSHNNIGLNLTNDQSYSPKITNCAVQQMSAAKSRGHRSDSDSESVFTDDDEWTHPLPLREKIDRNTRPSDSSIENESFILTYSQRFSKVAGSDEKDQKCEESKAEHLDKLNKVLRSKNRLLDLKDNEKIVREFSQLSDTENTSPAIGPHDATSVVDESYDIPRSHNLPYYNIDQLMEKSESTGTPLNARCAGDSATVPRSAFSLSSHCYTNAAPSKMENTVFRYDFIEQSDLPPVNRKLKPKINLEEKTSENIAVKPPPLAAINSANILLDSPGLAGSQAAFLNMTSTPPPSIDRRLKPNPYKVSSAGDAMRQSTGAPSSLNFRNNNKIYANETHTLPRQLRANPTPANVTVSHQRTASASVAALSSTQGLPTAPVPLKNEHKLQYFDLDVANAPPINRQSSSVGNLNALGFSRAPPGSDPSTRSAAQSSVVYNKVDFIKTEAFKRIREERKKESESGLNNK